MDTTFLLNTVCRICTWSSWTWALSQMSYNQVEQIALQGPFLLIGIGTWQWMGSLSLLALILRADGHLTLSVYQLPASCCFTPSSPSLSLALQFSLAPCPQKHILPEDFDPRAGFTGQHLDTWDKMILCCRRGMCGVVLWIFNLYWHPWHSRDNAIPCLHNEMSRTPSFCFQLWIPEMSPGLVKCFTVASVSEQHMAKLVLVWNYRERFHVACFISLSEK